MADPQCYTFLYNGLEDVLWLPVLEEVRNDIVAEFLLEKSALTEVQLDTILASDREGNLDFKRGLREKGMVSKGSFARTLNQGQDNIESSIYTFLRLSSRVQKVSTFLRNRVRERSYWDISIYQSLME